MLAFIEGRVVKIKEDSIVLDHNGLGSNLFVSRRDLSKIRPDEDIIIYTYMQVKEDGISLFGFLNEEDLSIFRLLIGVSGVGPKTALSCLGLYDVNELRYAIIADDSKTLGKVPGLGLKTAKKIILELKDKVGLPDDMESGEEDSKAVSNQSRNDALLALNALGYSTSEGLRIISQIKNADELSTEDLIEKALKSLGQNL